MKINPLVLFITGIVVDVLSMTLCWQFPQELNDKIYFSGQSIAMLLYIWTIIILSKEKFVLNLIATAWMGFAVNDTIEELFFDNTKFDWTEYACFGAAMLFIVYKLSKPR